MITASRVAPLRGEFEFRVWRRGRLLLCEREPNLIVTGAAQVLSQLLAGVAGAYAVDPDRVRDLGHAGRSGRQRFDGSLRQGHRRLHISLSPGGCGSTGRWGRLRATGLQIREFGLLTAGNALVARKVRQDGAHIEKAVDLALAGSWTVIF